MPIDRDAILEFVDSIGNISELVKKIEESSQKNDHPNISRVGLYKILWRLKRNEDPSLNVRFIDMFYSVAHEYGRDEIEFYKRPEINVESDYQI